MAVRRRAEFLDVFLRGAGPSLELLGAFALGLLVVGLAANLGYELLMAPAQSLATAWRPVVAIALCTGLAYLLYWLDGRRERVVEVNVDESRLAPPRAGLIWLFGTGAVRPPPVCARSPQTGRRRRPLLAGDARRLSGRARSIQPTFPAARRTKGPTRLHPFYIKELQVGSLPGGADDPRAGGRRRGPGASPTHCRHYG